MGIGLVTHFLCEVYQLSTLLQVPVEVADLTQERVSEPQLYATWRCLLAGPATTQPETASTAERELHHVCLSLAGDGMVASRLLWNTLAWASREGASFNAVFSSNGRKADALKAAERRVILALCCVSDRLAELGLQGKAELVGPHLVGLWSGLFRPWLAYVTSPACGDEPRLSFTVLACWADHVRLTKGPLPAQATSLAAFLGLAAGTITDANELSAAVLRVR